MSDFLTPKKKKRLVPFDYLPASWGLRGKSRELARVEYEYDGIDAALRLAEINNEGETATIVAKLRIALDKGLLDQYDFEISLAELTLTGKDLELERLMIDERHSRRPAYEIAVARADILFEKGSVDHQVAILEAKIKYDRVPSHQGRQEILDLRFAKNTVEYDLEKNRIDFDHGVIDKRQYEKACATIKAQPWIDIIEHGFDASKGINGVYFEFDWNIYWIDALKEAGYEGSSESDIIDRWFAAVCRNQVQNTTLGDGPVPFSISIRS